MQMPYLDNWDVSDDSLSSSLTGAIGALEASTLRLPVVCGSKVMLVALISYFLPK